MVEFRNLSKIPELYIRTCLINLGKRLIAQKILLFIVTLLFSIVAVSQTFTLKVFNGRTNSFLAAFTVRAAITDEEHAVGLSNYSTLPKKEGLLLVFDKAKRVKIWTKFMKFPIDIIFIDKNERISTIHHSVPPESNKIFTSHLPSSYVLELNAGDAKRFNIKKDDYVTIGNMLLN